MLDLLTKNLDRNLQSKVFFVWGGFCVICVLFVYLTIYETKGLTLEEVNDMYAEEKCAWRSKNYRPQAQAMSASADHEKSTTTTTEIEEAGESAEA